MFGREIFKFQRIELEHQGNDDDKIIRYDRLKKSSPIIIKGI